MIEVLPERDQQKLNELYSGCAIPFEEGCIASVAKFGQEVLGFCLFKLESDRITVLFISPENDIMLADGILRSALHVGVVAGVKKTYFSESAPKELFAKLKFIGDEPNSLRIEKLFESCCGGCGSK